MSKSWRLINSWWIILPFTIFFYWSAFYYIAATAKNRKWFYYGLIYTIPFILLISRGHTNFTNPIDNFIMGIVLLFWFVSIGHAFLLRKEYLIRLETLKRVQPTDDDLRRKIEKEYGITEPTIISKKPKTSPEKTTNFNKNVNAESIENDQSNAPLFWN